MKKKPALAITASTVWISVSEFFRNEHLLKSYWVKHFESLGLRFPDAPMNGAIWGLWALLFSAFLYFLSRDSSLPRAAVLGWLGGFVLMWVVSGNLGVLPLTILPYAIPLSAVEVWGAIWILHRFAPRS